MESAFNYQRNFRTPADLRRSRKSFPLQRTFRNSANGRTFSFRAFNMSPTFHFSRAYVCMYEWIRKHSTYFTYEALNVPVLFHGFHRLIRYGFSAPAALFARHFNVTGLAIGETVSLVKALILLERQTAFVAHKMLRMPSLVKGPDAALRNVGS